MKRIFSVLLIVSCVFVPTTFTGCATPPARIATNVAGTQVITVDAAMNAWRDWVIAGHATQAQVDRVKALYRKYYAAALIEQRGLETYVNTKDETAYKAALAAVAATSADLISFITQLTPVK